MSIYLKEGEAIRLGWGAVTYSPHYDAIEVLPIPLNYLKRLWYWLIVVDGRYLMSNMFKEHLEKRYAEGFEKGRQVGQGELLQVEEKLFRLESSLVAQKTASKNTPNT